MLISCLAIDDEPAALNLLVSYIKQTPFLKLAGQFDNAIDALKEIHNNDAIGLLFLDINMPDLNGIELARIIDQSANKKNIRIVFSTAYDQYAIDGFKVDALDYLLKPYNFVDFSRAAAKAYDYFSLLLSQPRTFKNPDFSTEKLDYIYLKVDNRLSKVNFSEILYIEGLKDYVKIYLRGNEKPLLTLVSLKRLEEKLSPQIFLRLHRSFIVSTLAIDVATKKSVLIGKTIIPVSEYYKEIFNKFLVERML